MQAGRQKMQAGRQKMQAGRQKMQAGTLSRVTNANPTKPRGRVTCCNDQLQ